MPRFNEFLYNTQKYGDKSKLAFSAEPMVATAINYNWIDISYSIPDGGTDGYVGFRIVRSQDGYPETEDDGVVIYEKLSANLSTSGAVDGKTLSDNSALWIPLTGLAAGKTAPLLQEGQFAYYRAWVLKTAAGDWVPAGDCYTLLPKKHGVTGGYAVKSVLQGTNIVDQAVNLGVISSTHDRFMSYIPTVFTSISNSGLDVPNPEGYSGNALDTGGQYNTLLSSFMSAFSFTVDEMLTFAYNTLPPADGGQFTSPNILALQSSQFGVPQDSLGISKTQKRLVRDSIRNYARKGTLKGLQDYVQDVTNYSATITESGNKVLGHENSTFDIQGWKDGDAVGDWIPTSYSGTTPTATITVDATQTTATGATGATSNGTITIGAGLKTFPLVLANPVAGIAGVRIKAIARDTPTYFMEGPANLWYNGNSNSITNNNFDTDTSGWTFGSNASISRSTSRAYSGAGSLKVSSNTGNADYWANSTVYSAVTAGNSYLVSAYVQSETYSTKVHIRIDWYNSSNTLISTSESEDFAVNASSWTRAVVSADAPVGAVNAIVTFRNFSAGSGSESMFWDAVSLQSNDSANYVNGGTLEITVDKFNGSGSPNNWNFAVSGEVGQTGDTIATAIDTTYSAKVVTTASNAAVALGAGAPITKGIPVVGGVNYKLSYQGKRSGSSGSISPTITWYDNLGTVVVPAAGEFPTSPSVAVTTSFVRYESSWIAPMTAAYATIQFLFSVANTYWIDMVMLYEPKYSTVTFASGDGTRVSYEGVNSYVVGDVISVRGVVPTSYNLSRATVNTVTYNGRGKQTGFTVLSNIADTFVSGGTVSKYEARPTYAEARGVLVSLNPSKTNYIYNPSFEGSGNWDNAAVTVERISNGVGALYDGPVGARTSAYRFKVTGIVSGLTSPQIYQQVGVGSANQLPKNKTYTFSIYIRSNTGTTTNPLVIPNGLGLAYLDSVDGTVSTAKTLKLTTDWQRVSLSLWVPDNKVDNFLYVGITPSIGQVIEIDAAQLEIGNVATDYFDGTMTSSGCAWTKGSANSSSSSSIKYTNLSYRLSRLRQGITGFLPINTPWAIEYIDNDASPQQYSGIS